MKGLSEDRGEEMSFSWPMFMCLCRDRQRNSVATFTRIWGTINDAIHHHKTLMLLLLEREREGLKHSVFPTLRLYQAGLWLLDVPIPSVDSLWQTSVPVFKVIYSGKNKIEWRSTNVFLQLFVFLAGFQRTGNLRLVRPLYQAEHVWKFYINIIFVHYKCIIFNCTHQSFGDKRFCSYKIYNW